MVKLGVCTIPTVRTTFVSSDVVIISDDEFTRPIPHHDVCRWV
jgi:hypothetical protein